MSVDSDRSGEERYGAFIANSSEGIWRLEFDPPIDTTLPVAEQVELAFQHGRFAECNEVMARMYGLDGVEGLIGKSLDVMLSPSHPGARAFLASIIEAGYRATDAESSGRDAQGQDRFFSNSMTGIVEDGCLVRVWGTQRDITDRKLAEEARAYLAAIVDSSDDAIISKDLNGIIRSCNRAAERIFGYSAAELIGQPVRLLIPADRRREEDDILARIRRGERVDHFETVRVAKGGRRVEISLTVSAVRNSAGVIVGASKIARDITDRRRAELERIAAAAERERLLEAERLARAEAERASRGKDDFVAMVSHELRTPLNAILGWTQLLTRTADPELLRRGLDVVARNARLQAQLISDLLDISRIVAGKLCIDTETLDLGTIVNAAVETIEGEALAKGVTLERRLDVMPAQVAGDSGRLQQIVWNLLSNAIKFTPASGHVRVTVRHAGSQAEIEVADDGAGIRADFLPHVFDRFHQADRSITRRFGGLGLGLSIVKHLVDLHGGTVRVESAGENQGATFTIALPLIAATVGPHGLRPDAGDDHASPDPAGDAVLGTIRVLVVEDERDTLDFLIRLLEGHGATVLAAATAIEALSIVRERKPDLMISDIGLPGVDGYDLMQQVRRENLPPHSIPAIALTAYARTEDRMRALRAGFQAHMAKPVEPAELIAMVASFVELAVSQRRTP